MEDNKIKDILNFNFCISLLSAGLISGTIDDFNEAVKEVKILFPDAKVKTICEIGLTYHEVVEIHRRNLKEIKRIFFKKYPELL